MRITEKNTVAFVWFKTFSNQPSEIVLIKGVVDIIYNPHTRECKIVSSNGTLIVSEQLIERIDVREDYTDDFVNKGGEA